MADPIDLRTPISSLRGARRSQPLQTFDVNANVSANFARAPIDDGDTARAAGRAFAAIGATLADLADAGRKQALAAEVEASGAKGATDAAAAVGMPKVAGGAGAPAGGAAATARAFFEAQGWSPVAASAIVGNLMQESGANLNPAAFNPRDPGGSVGVAQWNRERRAALERFAAERGGDWRDLNTQLAFHQYELTTSERATADRLRAARTIEEATDAAIGYYRPQGWTAGNPRGGNGYANRLANARSVLGGGGITVTLPEIMPLQLRRDGTPQGEAYDMAVLKTGGYRAKAAMQAGLDALAQQYANDPDGFEKEAAKLRDRYVGAFAAVPELQATADAEFEVNALPLRRQILSAREQAADRDMKAAAAEAVTTQLPMLERQAYALGANADGDAQLAILERRADTVIESALSAGAITPAEAARQRQALTGTLTQARFDGVFDALKTPAEKRAFAERLATPEVRADLLGKMPEADYNTLALRYRQRAREAIETEDAAMRVERARFAKLLADDVASIGATGQGLLLGGLPLAPADVARVLGEDKAQDWAERRTRALQLYSATEGLERLTPEQMAARLQGLEPAPGAEGFADAQALYGQAAKAADAVLKQRSEDPAAAVEQAFPALQDPAMRENPQTLVAGRLIHQEALGIPELARQPLTNAEAKRFAGRLTFFDEDDPAQMQVINGLAAELQASFGPYADEAMAQVLRVNGVTREASQQGAALIARLAAGERLTRADGAAMDAAVSRDRAERAMQGQAAPPAPPPARPVAPRAAHANRAASPKKQAMPNAAAVEYLRANPDQAQFFDQKYGAGAAEPFLAATGRDQRTRTLPDGSRETVYENGWVETLKPDGTIDGRQM